MTRHPVQGRVAVVTGAGSGIGRALVLELARRGARVSGCDVDAEGLAETARLCPGDLHTALVDVGDREAVHDYAQDVRGHFGVVHQLWSNAGIAFAAAVADSTWEDYERVLRVNLDGVIHGTLAFLPHLIASGDGQVVSVSSLNGYFAQPGMSHYCTSKFAVRGFTETLRSEMLLEGQPVRVCVVHPGGVATNISEAALRRARAAGTVTAVAEARARTYREKLLRMDPAVAAATMVDGAEKGRSRVRVGSDAVLIDRVSRLLPATAPRLAVLLERRLRRAEEPSAG